MKKIVPFLLMICVWFNPLHAQPQHNKFKPKLDYNYLFCYELSSIKHPITTFENIGADVSPDLVATAYTPVPKLSIGGGINARLKLHKTVEINLKGLLLDKGFAQTKVALPNAANDIQPSANRTSVRIWYLSFPISLRYNFVAHEKIKLFAALGWSQDINLMNKPTLYERFGMSWVASTGIEWKVSDLHAVTIEPTVRASSQPYSNDTYQAVTQKSYIYEPYSIGFVLGINRLSRKGECPN